VLITNHVLAGALIGTFSPGPVSAFAAGVVSHFVMDAVPHWGGYDIHDVLQVAVVDGLVGATALALVARAAPRDRRTRIVAGMLGAAVPDTDKPWDVFLGGSPFPAPFDRFHARLQRESRRRLPQEFLVATAGALVVRRALRARFDESMFPGDHPGRSDAGTKAARSAPR
jgi:hypothetical protein